MRTDVSTEEVAFYRENGFLVLPDLLSAAELAEWRGAVMQAVEARAEDRFAVQSGAEDVPGSEASTPSDEYYKQVFTQRVNLWQTSDQVRELMFDRRLGRLVADLAGVDGIRIWHDQALLKQPYANFTAFHLDVPYWSFTSPDAISVWVALDDATVENGCLHYVPGSHKAEKYHNVDIGRELGALFKVYPEWITVRPVPCPVPAGGACFHNGLTFHGAGANMTPGRRLAMTCAYMPDGAIFNGEPHDILPPLYLEALKLGDPLVDEAHNPLIYSRNG